MLANELLGVAAMAVRTFITTKAMKGMTPPPRSVVNRDVDRPLRAPS